MASHLSSPLTHTPALMALQVDILAVAKNLFAGTVMAVGLVAIQLVIYSKYLLPAYVLIGGKSLDLYRLAAVSGNFKSSSIQGISDNASADEQWDVVFIVIWVKQFAAPFAFRFVNHSIFESPCVTERFSFFSAAYMRSRADVWEFSRCHRCFFVTDVCGLRVFLTDLWGLRVFPGICRLWELCVFSDACRLRVFVAK